MKVKFVDGLVFMYADEGKAITDGVHAAQTYCVDPKMDYPKDIAVEWKEISMQEAHMDTDMRTIKIIIQTDSEEDLDYIADSIGMELSCASVYFEMDTMKVEEVK